jgi:TonB family protein
VHDLAETPIVSDVPRQRVHTGESLVVLTRDSALVRTLKGLGSEHHIASVDVESELANELMGDHAGVAIIDTAAISTPIEHLTERLKSQFPDLVLIVAGKQGDQGSLNAQITNGTVYRFLHKPVSEQRVRLFVDAAWRRHGEELSGATDSLSATGVLPEAQGLLPRSALIGGGIVFAVLLVVGGWLMTRKPAPARSPNTSAAAATSPSAVSDPEYENLLSRGDAAVAAGALVAPPDTSAADFYRKAMQRNGSDPRAAAGIEKVIDKLLSAAELQLASQHLDEAQKLTDQARAIKPDHLRVTFLATQIGKERERALLAQARQAASSGNVEGAIAVLDGGAARDAGNSTVAADAPQELEQKKLDDRVAEYLAKATDRLNNGQLVEPPEDNARFFIESARAVAPKVPAVNAAEQQLKDALVARARKALSAGNLEQAQSWISAAADSGVSEQDITELTQEAQRAQADAKSEALARANRTLDEAKAAALRQDYAGARRWLAEARDAGAADGDINAVERDVTAAQDAGMRASLVVQAGSLELEHYTAPTFPLTARERGVSGWVDVQFLVRADGSVADTVIMEAEPVGVFEQAAVEAIKKWRYKPVLRDGKAVEQRAHLRMKFALDK